MYGVVTHAEKKFERRNIMLWTIIIILLVLWLLGFATHAVGSLIHILLVVALVIFVIQLIQGRRV